MISSNGKLIKRRLNCANLLCWLVLFLPLGTAKHFIGSYSYINGYLVDYLVPAFYLSEFLVWGVIFSFFWKKRFSFFPRKLPQLLTIVILGFLLVNCLSSQNPIPWLYRLYRLAEAFLLFKVVSSLLQNSKNRERFSLFFAGGVLGAGVLGILQFLMQRPLFGYLPLGETQFQLYNPAVAKIALFGRYFIRAYSGFPHPNVFAAYLVIGLLAVFFTPLISKKFARAVSVVGVAALCLTFSRAGVLALVAPASSYWFIKFRKKVPILALFFLLLAGFVASPRFSESLSERLSLASLAFTLWQGHPWFGVGLNNFSYFASQFKFQPAHSIFLLSLAEGGLVGIVLFLFFFKKFFRRLSLPGGTLLLSLLVFGLLDHFLLTTYQGITLFSLTLGVVFAYTE